MRAPGLLLISPGILKWTDVDFGLPHLVSLGGYVRQRTGVRVEILDLNYEAGDHRHLERVLDGLGPFLAVGISCYSSFDRVRVMALARFLKTLYPEVPLVTGGYHASAVPEDLVFDGSPFDVAMVGEGERPLAALVEGLLAGEGVVPGVRPQEVVEDLDSLPPYQWDLLDRYWPVAGSIGRKFQIYLSRGCPYHCTFCMERAKSGYRWRAFSPERAVDELARLAARTPLEQWFVNVADPLFGFDRSWRRQVLRGILERGLLPRQYWTLTRSDDLQEEDVELLARARFSIGIGLESGSPRMLRLMQKARDPGRYLDAQRRLARASLEHGLNWAANVIVGHPGETRESMQETLDFATELVSVGERTCGWLSVDPFRLYPGSQVHAERARYEAEHGARFPHPEWWRHWFDGPFLAEHLDPSADLGYRERVEFMHSRYRPLVERVHQRFRGPDRLFEASLLEQREVLSEPAMRDLLARAERAVGAPPREATLRFPLGLHVRDPRTRRREEAVRALLERGVLRTERLVEALLLVVPEDDLLLGAGFGEVALGLEAMNPLPGSRVADARPSSGYVAALLARLVGESGEVSAAGLSGGYDGIWCGAALPTAPTGMAAHLEEGGRLVTWLGPRFRDQDLVCLTRRGPALVERVLARGRAPALVGAEGWVR